MWPARALGAEVLMQLIHLRHSRLMTANDIHCSQFFASKAIFCFKPATIGLPSVVIAHSTEATLSLQASSSAFRGELLLGGSTRAVNRASKPCTTATNCYARWVLLPAQLKVKQHADGRAATSWAAFWHIELTSVQDAQALHVNARHNQTAAIETPQSGGRTPHSA